MKALCCKFYMVIILFISILLGLSCSHDTDLLADAVLSDDIKIENIAIDDFFKLQTSESLVLSVLTNDTFSADGTVQITTISDAIYGSVEIAQDSLTIIYTPPQPTEDDSSTEESTSSEDEASSEEESATEGDSTTEEDSSTTEDSTNDETVVIEEETTETVDTFTYTAEVTNEDETTTTTEATVEVVVETSEETTTDEEEEEAESEDEAAENTSDDDTTESDEVEEDPVEESNTPQSANLLFKSGFEGVQLSAANEGYQYFSGTDSSTGYTWPMRILGSDFTGIHRVNDDGGEAIDNRIENTTGHNGGQTSTLYQEVKYDVQVTQTPYQINNIKENPDELYMSYWMKTDDTSVKGANKWRAIWEYKTDDYATRKDGFRMIAFMATDYQGKPYWKFQGDTSPQDPVWEVENYNVPVIMNEWFKVEYFIKWSDGQDGYASMKINGQLIGEHSGPTTSNSDDLDFIMLTQVYGNSHPMHQWVDDIEIWDGLPN